MAFRVRFVKNIIRFARQRGADLDTLLQAAGYHDLEAMDDETQFIGKEAYDQVITKALEQSGDPLMGLHLGEYLSLSAAGLIVQIAQNSRTVLEALQYTVNFANLGCQELPFELKELDHAWELSLKPNPEWEAQYPQSAHQTIDGQMVFSLREFQSLSLQKHHPLSVHFAYAKPQAKAEYDRVFQCPVRIGMPYTAIYLRKEHVADKVISSDYDLLRLLVGFAEQKLANLENYQSFTNTVRQTIVQMRQTQFPTILQIAANLNMSVRTLQRRLKQEGYTYQNLTDDLKQQFALDYLRHKNLSIKEIAYSLDFSEASSFVRSFKRWYGASPQVYREQHLM